MTRYLGIDYGQKRVGLAVGEFALATPLLAWTNDENLTKKISELCNRERIEQIICGVPEGKLEKEIEAFATELSQKTGIPVVLHPETLSTQEAVSKLRAGGAKRKKLRNDHIYAAALILEDYLETKSSVN